MVMINIKGVDRYYDGYAVTHLEQMKELVKRQWDGVLLYGGYEGDGKSTKCSQDMAYLDPDFDLSRVCFNLDQLSHLMDVLPPGSAIQYDESWKDISNSARFQKSQHKLIRILTEKRKKRLFIGIVSSTFFDLNKYFVIHRTRAYIHIYADGLDRGFFKLFNRELKEKLYQKGKKDWNISAVKPLCRGRFTNWMPFSQEEYDKKKDEGTKANDIESNDKIKSYDEGFFRDGQDEVLLFLRDVKELFKRGQDRGLMPEIAAHLGITRDALDRRITKYSKTRRKLHEKPRFEPVFTSSPKILTLNKEDAENSEEGTE